MEATLAFVGGNKIFKCDVVRHEGDLWLVPEWLDNTSEGWSKPARIIRLPHPRQESGKGRYTIQRPIPKWYLDGPWPEELADKLVVHDPPIRIVGGTA
ncbi:hypothetical protein FSZ31_10735 [Sphingorhabdus soli]|uniref:Uncharacterized protein n=1 Tax=Flavisphingopyxis soli TaxID=2601267 RepID=A0A5C6U9F4_9SPHN|nr:hypothetical protein [Sphingorhabdus soli]TXC68168.1 hypothetical protein FSZ31_10735 [Sphingorhabdus soli]